MYYLIVGKSTSGLVPNDRLVTASSPLNHLPLSRLA